MKLHQLSSFVFVRARLVRVILMLTLLPFLMAPFADTAAAAPDLGNRDGCRATHIYERGEPLNVVAKWYGISVSQLRESNPQLKNRGAKDGEILCIPFVRIVVKDNNYNFHGYPPYWGYNASWHYDGGGKYYPYGGYNPYIKLDYHSYVYLNRVTVWGDYLPRWHDFAVRVRADRDSPWIKVGTFSPGRDGSFEKHFRLPPELRDARFYEVCLKDLDWDFSLCTRVDLRFGPRLRTPHGPLYSKKIIAE